MESVSAYPARPPSAPPLSASSPLPLPPPPPSPSYSLFLSSLSLFPFYHMDDISFSLCIADAPRTSRTLPVLSLYFPCTHNSYTAAVLTPCPAAGTLRISRRDTRQGAAVCGDDVAHPT